MYNAVRDSQVFCAGWLVWWAGGFNFEGSFGLSTPKDSPNLWPKIVTFRPWSYN
jgi:hypothetical protein